MPTIPTSKKDLSEVIIKSFSIYELTEIRIEGHRYPRRRISQQRIGFFRTLENATNAMNEFIKVQKDLCEKRRVEYGDICLGYYIFEQKVLNRYSTFYCDARPQKRFSFNRNGEFNDFVALDEFGFYCGREKKDISFKVGDIVEVINGDYADLAIVGALPLTTDTYRKMEEDDEECEHPSHFLDESNDCYMVYYLRKNGSHSHPACYEVFRPTHPIPEKYAVRLRAHLKEMGEKP